MQGSLLSQDFLNQGIQVTPAWSVTSVAGFNDFVTALHAIYRPYDGSSKVNEAVTEDEIILKVLGALGWHDLSLSQVVASGKRREDVLVGGHGPDNDAFDGDVHQGSPVAMDMAITCPSPRSLSRAAVRAGCRHCATAGLLP